MVLSLVEPAQTAYECMQHTMLMQHVPSSMEPRTCWQQSVLTCDSSALMVSRSKQHCVLAVLVSHRARIMLGPLPTVHRWSRQRCNILSTVQSSTLTCIVSGKRSSE